MSSRKTAALRGYECHSSPECVPLISDSLPLLTRRCARVELLTRAYSHLEAPSSHKLSTGRFQDEASDVRLYTFELNAAELVLRPTNQRCRFPKA